jgi:hypothetical protein
VAALIDVSETVRHRLQCPIELSRIVNAAEQRHISRGDGRMSHIFNDRSDKSADGLRRHREKLSCYSWSSGDRLATSAYDLTSLPVRASISSSWIDRTEFRNSGQLNISGRNLANSRSIVSSVTARSDSSESRAMRSSLSGSLNIVPLNVSNPMSSRWQENTSVNILFRRGMSVKRRPGLSRIEHAQRVAGIRTASE